MKVLLIEDDAEALKATSKVLKSLDAEVIECTDGEQALEHSRHHDFDLILSDVRMPRISGYEFLKALKTIRGEWAIPPLVFMTAYGQLEDAVWAMKSGAVDFILKPFNRARLKEALDSVKRMARTKQVPQTYAKFDHPRSKKMIELFEVCDQIAPSQSSVMIVGESGVGKERIARRIHQASNRRDKSFIALNCAAIPEALMESELFGYVKGAFSGADQARAGLFEAAHGGTLLLDELGEMPTSLQAKLLRVLQEGEVRRVGATESKKVDVRILAATNQDLSKKVESGEFRSDLLFRLDVIRLEVPPLRERMEDFQDLCESILDDYFQKSQDTDLKQSERAQLSPEALACLKLHSWPGNVRELSNVLERAMVLSPTPLIEVDSLPSHFQSLLPESAQVTAESELTIPFGTPLKEVEDLMIFKALEMTKGDKLVAAKILGVHPRTIYRRLEAKQASALKDSTSSSSESVPNSEVHNSPEPTGEMHIQTP